MDKKMGTGMVSMKMSPVEKKASYSPVASSGTGVPDYPWGLEINLSDAALKKLRVEELPQVGDELVLHCRAKVTRTSATARDKNPRKEVALQITDMQLEGMADDNETWKEVKRERAEMRGK